MGRIDILQQDNFEKLPPMLGSFFKTNFSGQNIAARIAA